ncbi:MAG: glycosyltransferase [Blautia wexlerae]
MNILHYSLGFPPFRRGGMIKYCMDLIEEQTKAGHNVSLIWPGEIYSFGEKSRIIMRKKYSFSKQTVCLNFELINPLPVPLLDGIQQTDAYMKKKSKIEFDKFFKSNSFDILHIHTLMGLPIELVEEAKKNGVRVVYTSHDYFGLCPRASLFFNDSYCKNRISCKDCEICNKNAISLKKICILQSKLYSIMKDKKILQYMRKRHLKKVSIADNNNEIFIANGNNEKYVKLRNYYINILKMCDKLHFNSNLSMETYGEFFDLKDSGEVIGITHSSIINKKHIKNKHDVLNFAYLGPCTDSRKGFFALKQAMDELYKTYNNEFRLHVFSPISGETPCYLVQHNPYKYEELDYIMENIDMVIVPSVWHETFGFTVLEALSYGVPVLVSENVGAKDLIVQEKNGLVTKLEKHELEASIEKILQNPQILVKMNKYIVENQNIKTINMHMAEICNQLYCN